MALVKLVGRKIHLNGKSGLWHCQRWRSSSQKDDYQYIQRSNVPTFHFQASLPRLPIPELEKTCERYLAAQQPLLDTEAFERCKTQVSQFQQGDGKDLHFHLKSVDKKNKHTSYISAPWFDMYLRDRIPLPINYNPSIVFINDPKPEYNNQITRATNMLISSLRFMKSIRAEILEPEVYHLNPKKSDTDLFRTVTRLLPSSLSWYGAYLFKAFPLDMSQYGSLFNATRIPDTGKDRLFRNETAKHVLVMKNANFYVFDVIDKDGNILSPGDILACMTYIASENTPPAEYPIGVLTAGNRDSWAETRKHLESSGNSDVLNLIDSSFFNLVLDGNEIGTDRRLLVQHFLHGDGRNRWFDKSFSLIFTQDGIAGVNFEHSWGDGVAVLRYFQDIYKDSTTKPQVHPDTKPSNCDASKLVRRLDFKLDDKAKAAINSAKKEYTRWYNSLTLDIMEFLNFGKRTCKSHRVSPDSIMQLGFQLAFYKQTGRFETTYESCSTAAFKHGRTETMRPCTMATKTFCEAVTKRNKPSNAELRELISQCSQVHGNLTKEAAMGQGFDRHLFGLRLLATQKGGPMPAIFQDSAYTRLNHNVLSTSTLSSDMVMAGGFGPVVNDGYGIGYSIFENRLGTIVSSYPPHRDGLDFTKCLESSFEDIYNILNVSK